MKPTGWSGFDARKVCPRCGAYQTRLMKSKQAPASQSRLFLLFLPALILLPVLIVLTVPLAGRPGTPKTVLGLGFLMLALVVLFLLLILRRILPGLIESYKKTRGDGDPSGVATIVYSLHCTSCGHHWQATEAEWEQEAQVMREAYHNRPQAPGSDAPGLAQEADDKQTLQWTEPNPKRGAFLVISAIFLLCIVSVALFGMIYLIPYKGTSYYTILTTIGILGVFWISIGVLFLAKNRLIKLVPIILLVLFYLALRFFLN